MGTAADKTVFEGTTESGERRRAKSAVPVGHEACCRQRLHGEKRRRRRRERCKMGGGRERHRGTRQMPQISLQGFDTCEERKSCRGRVEERARGVSEDGMTVRSNEGRHSEERVS